MHRLRHAHRTALLLSTSLACISLALIICVAPLLPTPDRSANIRLGLVLALACEVALDSALLLVAGVVWLRRQSRTDFLDGGDSGMFIIWKGGEKGEWRSFGTVQADFCVSLQRLIRGHLPLLLRAALGRVRRRLGTWRTLLAARRVWMWLSRRRRLEQREVRRRARRRRQLLAPGK